MTFKQIGQGHTKFVLITPKLIDQ